MSDWSYQGPLLVGVRGRLDGRAVHLADRSGAGDCERPNVLLNSVTGEMVATKCKGSDTDKCRPCADRKRSDWAWVIANGALFEFEAFGAVVLFGTVTAGGKLDGLPFDPALCKIKHRHRCDGAKGCRADPMKAAEWNTAEPKNWNRTMWNIQRFLRRRYGDQVVVKYSVQREAQRRGLAHRHFLMTVSGVPDGVDLRGVIVRAAGQHGYGSQTDVQVLSSVADIRKRAWYVAKYIAKSSSGDVLPWLVVVPETRIYTPLVTGERTLDGRFHVRQLDENGEPMYSSYVQRPAFVSVGWRKPQPSKSQAWSVTHKSLRLARAVFVQALIAERKSSGGRAVAGWSDAPRPARGAGASPALRPEGALDTNSESYAIAVCDVFADVFGV